MKNILILLLSISILSCQKLDIERQNLLKTENVSQTNEYIVAKSSIVDISLDGIIEHGHCWNTSGSPTINDNKTLNGEISSREEFEDTLYGLSPLQTHYVRAYLSDGSEVKYGAELTISPLLNNISVSNYGFTYTSWNSGKAKGKVSNLGSLTILGYGHCWDTVANPSISDNFNFIEKSDENEFSSTIPNLTYNQTFYIRAFVKINNSTVIYSSNEIEILLPKLTVSSDGSMITGSTSAILYGAITSYGVYQISDHGFCWSYDTSIPTLNNNILSLGTANAAYSFEKPLYGIVQNATLYFRAFAVENNVVTYGNVMNLKIN